MIDPAIGAMLAAAFALLFVTAAIHKLRDLGTFAEAFGAYQLLPESLARLAWLLPLLELAIGASLLAAATRAAAAAAGAALLLVYAAAIGINLRRGRRELACGCGGPQEHRPIGAWMVWRNLGLAALLTALRLPSGPRPLEVIDALTILAGTAVVALIYMSLERLRAPGPAALRSSS
jgi:hypothetical protein